MGIEDHPGVDKSRLAKWIQQMPVSQEYKDMERQRLLDHFPVMKVLSQTSTDLSYIPYEEPGHGS